MKYIFFVLIAFCFCWLCLKFYIIWEDEKLSPKPSIYIEYWKPKKGAHGGRNYFDLIKLKENQYLFVGKDGFGKTFDSLIITINP